MKFRYLKDPLFISCLALYFVNRLLIKRLIPGGFFHDSFNDLICIPFWVPIMLFFMRKTGMRDSDSPPRSYEIIIPLLLWSIIFEIYLPRVAFFSGLATSDHTDIIYYTTGAIIAALFWQSGIAGDYHMRAE